MKPPDNTPDMNNPVHRMAEKLNELFKLDPGAFHDVIEHRVKISDILAEHSDIRVTMDNEMGALSLINAIVELEYGDIIVAYYEEDGKLIGFRPGSTLNIK